MEADFSDKLEGQAKDHDSEIKAFHAKIDQLTVECKFFANDVSRLDLRDGRK